MAPSLQHTDFYVKVEASEKALSKALSCGLLLPDIEIVSLFLNYSSLDTENCWPWRINVTGWTSQMTIILRSTNTKVDASFLRKGNLEISQEIAQT